MFLVGGFADSPMLQTEVRSEFQHVLKVIIPNEVSLAVLRGQSNVNSSSSSLSSLLCSRRGPSRRCINMSTIDRTPPEVSSRTGGIVSYGR